MSALWRSIEKRFPRELAPCDLPLPAAVAMATMIASGSYNGARLTSCRGGDAANPLAVVVTIEVDVPIGQRTPVNEICTIEPIAIVYGGKGCLPMVYPLRDDFPFDVPHLHLALPGHFRSLCLFDMPLEEALRVATPLVLIERVRFWLTETAHGRLHGEDQPLDPIFIFSRNPVILPHRVIESNEIDLLFGWRASEQVGHPVFLEDPSERENSRTEGVPRQPAVAAIMIVTKPLPHARLRMFPTNVAELIKVFQELNADILLTLQASLKRWQGKSQFNALLELPCLIVIKTPIERTPGKVGGEASKAFLTHCRSKELGEKVGAFFSEGDHFGVVLGSPPQVNFDELQKLLLTAMDVHAPFDRMMAGAASGICLEATTPTQVTLIGAGALGSQIAITSAKMGLGKWTVIDPDHLLPHNQARHASSPLFVGWPKANAVVHEIRRLLGDDAASAIFGRTGSLEAGTECLASSSMILDASASVPTARWLGAVSEHKARTASVFLNPAGCDLVCLLEGGNRSPRLDHVEMSYYACLLGDHAPENHLSDGRVGLYPSGGCRTASLAISQADIGTLAPFAVKRLLRDPWPEEGLIEIRRVHDDGVTTVRFSPQQYRVATVADWTVSVSDEVFGGITRDRQGAGTFETGGILVGAWDRQTMQGYVVRHFAPPPDSHSMPLGFVRGAEGVHQELAEVQRRTGGNLTYVGEWHTHPAGMQSTPSQDDRILLRWIADKVIYLDVPPIMLIRGNDGLGVLLGNPNGRILAQTVIVG